MTAATANRTETALASHDIPIGATQVSLAQLNERSREIFRQVVESYLATGEPFDKAGSYAIQGRAGRYVPRVEGCYFNIVGLPLARLYQSLQELGWSEESISS